MVVPLTIMSLQMKGEVERPQQKDADELKDLTTPRERNLIFVMGVSGLLFVPVFKTVTHLPPFMGMMMSLGVLWVTTEILY